jgi:hypothetical protein
MVFAKRFLFLYSFVTGLTCFLFSPGVSRADIIGPGNLGSGPFYGNDGYPNQATIDENVTATLSAGTYAATTFSYAFEQAENGNPLGGSVTPFLANARREPEVARCVRRYAPSLRGETAIN